MRRRPCLAVACLSLLVLTACPPKPDPDPPAPEMEIVELNVGLSDAQRAVWRFTGEGSDLVPVALLRALKDVNTGKTFDKSLDAYGFLPSPAGPDNPYGLAIGWTTEVPTYALLKTEFVGLNCSACHTGQIETVLEDGRRVAMRFDGGSNMADIEAFAVAAQDSVEAMLKNPVEVVLFVWRLLTLEKPDAVAAAVVQARQVPGEDAESSDEASAAAADPSADDPSAEDMQELLQPYAEALQNDVDEPKDDEARDLGEHLAKVLRGEEAADGEVDDVDSGRLAKDLMEVMHVAEEARADIQDLLDFLKRYAKLLKNRLKLAKFALDAIENPDTPTPGPGRDDPWGIIRNTVFFEATALTAPTSIPSLYWSNDFVWYHADGNTNSVLQRNVAQALALGAYIDPETEVSSLHPRALFALENVLAEIEAPKWPEQYLGAIDQDKASRGEALFNAHCHSCHKAREGRLFPLGAIGTDPRRAENFLRPLDGRDFAAVIPETVQPLMDFAFDQAGISEEERKKYEVENPVWRGTGQYQARILEGIWSTAPYLHNGSVPTLYDLLLPPASRTDGFQLGDRTYDAKRVGYVLSTENPIFTYDATSTGGSNAGHEFGTDLSDEERWDLVEYLKTL